MANELSVYTMDVFTKDGLRIPFPGDDGWNGTLTISGDNWLLNVQTVGTSEEALLLGDVTPGGIMLAMNLDDTNFMTLRWGTGTADVLRFTPGDPPSRFRLDPGAVAPYVIANAAPVRFAYLLLEN